MRINIFVIRGIVQHNSVSNMIFYSVTVLGSFLAGGEISQASFSEKMDVLRKVTWISA